MKTKVTLMVGQSDRNVSFRSPDFFKVFLTHDHKFPKAYISTKDISETLEKIFNEHFLMDFKWVITHIAGARKVDATEIEITYLANIPQVTQPCTSGRFFSSEDLKNFNIEIDGYYEKLLSGRVPNF